MGERKEKTEEQTENQIRKCGDNEQTETVSRNEYNHCIGCGHNVIAGPVLRWSPSEHRTSLQASENTGQHGRYSITPQTDQSLFV